MCLGVCLPLSIFLSCVRVCKCVSLVCLCISLSLLAFHLAIVRWLLVGPTRSGTMIHQDPPGTAAWNVVTFGRKRWAVMSPLVPEEIAKRQSSPEGIKYSMEIQEK